MSIHAAIIGGGFAGTLQAVQLLRRGARVTLIERTDRLARGVAYSTRHADHLLNVRASGMSAFPDAPDHFAAWLAQPAGGAAFAERRAYGRYVAQLLTEAEGEAPGRLACVHGEAVDVIAGSGAQRVRIADGAEIAADVVILSIGNLAPAPPPGLDEAGPDYVGDPWARDVADGLGDADTVLLIGTGLTAIDAALMLDAAGYEGRIVAISRRGLVPRAHAEPQAIPPLAAAPEGRCTALLRMVRQAAGSIGWRAAVDQLRPATQGLWAGASVAERRRFLRHLRPWWDVHRHRIAPEIASRIEAMERAGRLAFRAGRIVRADATGVEWSPRESAGTERLTVARIVNCTGPEGNIARAGEPLLANLLAAGRIRPDPCRIGIDVDAESRTIGGDGKASDALLAIGPMTRGAFWEIVAVPDIRVQVASLAARVAA